MFELETLLAFGVGAGLVAFAPMVRKLGNEQLGDSMSNVGKTMAKSGIKVGVAVVGTAGKAARSIASHAAEAAESFVDLVAEARSEIDSDKVTKNGTKTANKSSTKPDKVVVKDVTVE